MTDFGSKTLRDEVLLIARILLAIAFVREHKRPEARALLASLQQEFPNNPLFAREIARLDSSR